MSSHLKGIGTVVTIAALVGGASLVASGRALAEEANSTAGRFTYKTFCSTCHGPDGRGDGPSAKSMRVPPADLTGISSRSNGRFDRASVARAVDTKGKCKGTGHEDMPRWGEVFAKVRGGQTPAQVQQMITDLVAWIETVQQTR